MSDITTNPTDNPDFDVHDDVEVADIERFNFERALGLLSLVEKIATVAPKATSLSGIALAEIEVMNNQAKDIARRRAQRVKEAEQRRFEAEQARVRKEQEAQEQALQDEGAQENAEEAQDAYDNDHAEAELVEPPPQPGQPSPPRRL